MNKRTDVTTNPETKMFIVLGNIKTWLMFTARAYDSRGFNGTFENINKLFYSNPEKKLYDYSHSRSKK